MKEFLLKTARLNRSIVSPDFEKTLQIINERVPLTIHKYPSGTPCFDWILPKKWIIRDAFIKDETGAKILDWKNHPLHVVIGSLPVRKNVSKEELLKKVYVSEAYPDAIPYVFKFYELDWGFCMTKDQRSALKGNTFEAVIDAEYQDGDLQVGEFTIPGESDECIMLMAHIDHPAQVNDGLAGAAVLLKLAEELKGTRPAYTLKFQFLPERIGSIAYLSHNSDMIPKIKGGIFLEMPGTKDYPLVLQHSKLSDTKLDRIAKYVLSRRGEKFLTAPCFQHVINDDGFYNSPGIDIPVISLSRSKPLEVGHRYHFPYYHTSKDDLEHFDFGAAEKYGQALKEIMAILSADRKVVRNYTGVPFLSKHKLWVDYNKEPGLHRAIEFILYNIDNKNSIFDLAEKCGVDFWEAFGFADKMRKAGLVEFLPALW